MNTQSSYPSTNAVQKMNDKNPENGTYVDITVEQAFDQFIESRRREVTDETLKGQKTAVLQFVEWLTDEDIQLSELNGFHLEQFYTYQKNRGLQKVTLQQYMTSVRQFLLFLERVEAVREGLSDKLRNPTPSKEEQRSDTEIEPERVQKILEFMERFEYAKQHHAVMKLLWRTGVRTGTLWSLDIDDFDRLEGEPVLKARHRPNQGTRLKKKKQGERIINLRSRTAQVVEDYIQYNRPDTEDEHGRRPLLATEHGRMSKTVIRRICYKWTCPEVTNIGSCDCDTPSTRQEANQCEKSVTPHVIRSASITYWRRNDVPTEVVSDRMDVSPDVIGQHYDRRTEEGKARQRRQFLEDL